MARFDAAIIEKQLLRDAKNERRKSPKPTRLQSLWAQTAWLEASLQIENERVVFVQNGRVFPQGGATVEATKRALEKIAARPHLIFSEKSRLEKRRANFALWGEIAALHSWRDAPLETQFLLESLAVLPLGEGPAASVLADEKIGARQLRAWENETSFPSEAREFARWLRQNRGNGALLNADFPLQLAWRLGVDGREIPPVFDETGGPFSLDLPAIQALLNAGKTPAQTLEIAGFARGIEFFWPDLKEFEWPYRSVAELKKLTARWAEIEQTARARWAGFWCELAGRDVRAARLALEFHALWLGDWTRFWRESARAGKAQLPPKFKNELLERLRWREQQIWQKLAPLADHPEAGEILVGALSLWRDRSARFCGDGSFVWNKFVDPFLSVAHGEGCDFARLLAPDYGENLGRALKGKPHLLSVALEWTGRRDADFGWLLAKVEDSRQNANFLRAQMKRLLAILDNEARLNSTLREQIIFAALPDNEAIALDVAYWKTLRSLAFLFATRRALWHAENLEILCDYWSKTAQLSHEFGWEHERAAAVFALILERLEARLRLCESEQEHMQKRWEAIETTLILCRQSCQTPECEASLLTRTIEQITRGNTTPVEFWDLKTPAQTLRNRPRLCAALLLAAHQSPKIWLEILPQIELFARFHLLEKFDALETPIRLQNPEFWKLAGTFASCKTQIEALFEWQTRAGAVPHLPRSVREIADEREKWAREIEFLEKLNAQNAATQNPAPKLTARIENLRARLASETHEKTAARLGELLQNLAGEWSQKALRQLVRAALLERLQTVCHTDLSGLKWNEDFANAVLIACETEENRRLASLLLREQIAGGISWKWRLPANIAWLEKLAQSGKNRVAFCEEFRAQIGEWELWIERDALQILQMGNRFSTCLSRGGCNAHSTIGNALDANKIVVYGRRGGQIAARQLWAVGQDWGLAGFSIYSNLESEIREKSGMNAAFHEFARRYCETTGLDFGSDSRDEWGGLGCESLLGASWYDDGIVAWEELAKTATENQKTPRFSGKRGKL